MSAVFLNASTLKVSWNAASPHQDLIGYDVIILKNNTEVSRAGVDNVTLSVEISSLDQCSNYTVRVTTNSSVGLRNYSTFEFVTLCGKWLVPLLKETKHHLNLRGGAYSCIVNVGHDGYLRRSF